MCNLLINNKKLMKEFNYEKNTLNPNNLTFGSNKKVWWKCEKGHEWYVSVSNRTRGTGCPYCMNRLIMKGYNDLFTTNPELKSFWNYEKNEVLPSEIGKGSAKKYWWKCEKNHEWDEEVRVVASGCRCPYCSNHRLLTGFNDTKTTHPELMDEWNYEKNTIKPEEVINSSSIKVWWKCEKNHEWEARISKRACGRGCPYCFSANQTSFSEQAIYFYLNKCFNNVYSRYKKLFDNGMEIDIFVEDLKIGIEYDGAFFHKNNSSKLREKKKYQICKENCIKLIRVREKGLKSNGYEDLAIESLWDGDHYNNLDDVIKQILRFMKIELDVDTKKDRIKILNLYKKDLQASSLSEYSDYLIKEWNYDKNKGIDLINFKPGSSIKVWWKCEKNHEWEASINKRVCGRGCPYCSNKRVLKGYNDLTTTNKKLLKEWNYEKNTINPTEIVAGSKKKVWWICEKGHEWEANVLSRAKGSKCPYCKKSTGIVM